MKFDEFYEETIVGLGGSLVDVELEESEIRLCLKKAIRTFKQKGHNGYRKSFFRLPVHKCGMTYQMPSDVNTVIRIIRPSFGFHANDEFSMAAFNEIFGYTSTPAQGDLLSYEFMLQKIERLETYTAKEAEFHFDEMTKKVHLHKAPHRDREVWLFEVYHDLGEEEYMDMIWIQSWALAEAKIILGQAYRKFSSLPGPDGSISLDGGSLIQEGNQEKERLLEDILNLVDGSVDYYGITFG